MDSTLRDDILKRFDHARATMESRLDAFGEEDAISPGVTTHWSVKDLVAHMIAWQEEFLDQAGALAVPSPRRKQYNDAGFNEEAVKARRGQPWAQVLDSWKITLGNIRSHVAGVEPEYLEWGQPYRGFLEGAVLVHLYEHGGQVASWIKKLDIREAD